MQTECLKSPSIITDKSPSLSCADLLAAAARTLQGPAQLYDRKIGEENSIARMKILV